MQLAQGIAQMKVEDAVFQSWFPASPRLANPRMRLLCFANAGSAESIYTGATIKQGKRTPECLADLGSRKPN